MNVGLGSLGLSNLSGNAARGDQVSQDAALNSPGSQRKDRAPEFSKVLREKSEPAKKSESFKKAEPAKKENAQTKSQRASPTTDQRNSEQNSVGPENKRIAAEEKPLNSIDATVTRKPLAGLDKQEDAPALEEDLTTTNYVQADQQAMMRFLFQMKDELGIEPQDIMEAMSALGDGDLLKSPEQTMAQVLDGLELQGFPRVRATELYENMLKETAEAHLAKWAQSSGRSVDMKVMGPEETKQAKMLASLERMNREFFPEKSLAQDPALAPLDRQARQGDTRLQQPGREDKAGNGKFVMPDFFAGAAVAAGAAGQGAGRAVSQGAHSAQATLTADALSPFALDQSQAITDADLPLPATVSVQTEPGFEASKLMGSLASAAATAAPAERTEQGDTETGREGAGDQAQSQSFQVITPTKPQDMFAPLASLSAQPGLKPADESANVRQVIQNAQLLIQKGGGEMKIQMSPEGMGHVDLKVSVQDGKVDIKMLTENNETKKLLESGLSDLRDNLIGQKLNVDSVKVDVAQKFQPDLDSQLAQQQREMAREFLGQFRQQNQAFRQGFADTTGMKSYGKRGKTMTPADVPAAARARDNSRRLDLVA